MDIKSWLVGLAFSLLGGWLVTWLFLKCLRKWMGLPDKPPVPDKPKKQKVEAQAELEATPQQAPEEGELRGVPPSLTGLIERLFFTILVAFDVAGIVAAMVGWMALKLATNWNREYWRKTPAARLFGFSALLAGLISMLFAFLGGLIARGDLWARFVSCI